MSPIRHIYLALNYWKFGKLGVFWNYEAVYLCLMGADQFFCVSVHISTIGLSQKNFVVWVHTWGTYIRTTNIGNIENMPNIWKFPVLPIPKYVPDVCTTKHYFTSWQNYHSEVHPHQKSWISHQNWRNRIFAKICTQDPWFQVLRRHAVVSVLILCTSICTHFMP